PFCHQKLFCHLDERLEPGDEVRYQAGLLKCAVCVRGRFNPFRNGKIRRALARDVDRLVAVSDEMGRALQSNGLGSSTTIMNGVSEDTPLASTAAIEAMRQRLGLEGRRVIFFGGRLDRLKGGLQLVEALALVREKHPTAVLLTVGEALPGFSAEMSAMAKRLGLSDEHLVAAGWLNGDELAAAYGLADVVATPSLCFESFGLVNVEAMAAGLPVVASFWGGPSNVVVDGETGFLVNPLQVAVLADRLERILSDGALAKRLGAAAQQRVRDVFGLQAQTDGVLALYEEMVT
ncbi:MAG: glycosyltransferase involved in cell wall biosynthesis, partial [Pseudohongiellaceae bacterium]